MLVQQLLKSAAAELAGAGIESSALEAQLLLQDCLDVSRSGLFLLLGKQVNRAARLRFQEFIDRRCQREPLQYILGECEFWSLDFLLTPDVLIPRPETEFLLEHVITVLDRRKRFVKGSFLDVCTGSGIIAVVLAREFAEARIHAADYSRKALAVARKNIVRHDLGQRIPLICADLLTGFKENSPFDVIVCNPPYVKAVDIPGLEPEVRDWEPELALSGGPTGMDVIQRIVVQAASHLTIGGWLFMEIGADIEKPVIDVCSSSTRYDQVKVVPDLAGNPRVLQARFIG